MAKYKGNLNVNIIIIVGITLVAILFTIVLVGVLFNLATDRSAEHDEFVKAAKSETFPNGIYNGSATIYQASWQGKKIDSSKRTGINRFAGDDRYPFEINHAKSLRNSTKDIIRINYNIPANPFWLRIATDEMVQTGTDSYLGAIQIQILPGLPFTIGYFRLSK